MSSVKYKRFHASAHIDREEQPHTLRGHFVSYLSRILQCYRKKKKKKDFFCEKRLFEQIQTVRQCMLLIKCSYVCICTLRFSTSVFVNRGSAEPWGSVSGCRGFRRNRPKLPGTKFATTVLCGCVNVLCFTKLG